MASVATYSAFTAFLEELKVGILLSILVLASPIYKPDCTDLSIDNTRALFPVVLISKAWHRLVLEIFYGENTFRLEPWIVSDWHDGDLRSYQKLVCSSPAIGP
jgi:hypothetical protein